jgi:hypothetical protein
MTKEAGGLEAKIRWKGIGENILFNIILIIGIKYG